MSANNPLCPHCGHTLSARELKTIARIYNARRLRKIGSAGGKASSAKVNTKERAGRAANVRWAKYREEQARKTAEAKP